MISLPELLRRFRRAWAPPGPALARVAPPVDVAARLRTEIQPVLDAVGEIQDRADTMRTEAETKAGELLETASREADQRVRDAEHQAPEARAQAAEHKHHSVDAEIASVHAAGREGARRIAEQAQERLPELLEKVRACVLNGPDAPP